MKLIDNAKSWWRMSSIRVAAVWAILVNAWPYLPEAQRADLLTLLGIPAQYLPGLLALAALVSIAAARVTKQDALHKDSQ